MPLIHQAGSVHVGEVVRYTLTYTPALDPIQPAASELHVKVKNTSATPLRAAYLHGPYTLYAACYPKAFDPNTKYERQDDKGIPQFEPYLKAGGSWDAVISVPQHLRPGSQQHSSSNNQNYCKDSQNVTWVIEIVSQVIFSTTASVHFELLVDRDETSMKLSPNGRISANELPPPTQLDEHWSHKRKGERVYATKGVFSESVSLVVDDTASLWNTPPFPPFEEKERISREGRPGLHDSAVHDARPDKVDSASIQPGKKMKKKRVHFVVLTHGLHSNLGADMLYLKESIDAAAKNAKTQKKRAQKQTNPPPNTDSIRSSQTRQDECDSDDDGDGDGSDDDHEEVIVRGFPGNAVRTERGIQYLGKRLAKYVLLMTYPDQPYLPLKTSRARFFSKSHSEESIATERPGSHDGIPDAESHAYKITSISFIGHSLGGPIQMYAIAYIQKHSPKFFEQIRPVNFIALASPFLGLSYENPLYVRFALDFGLVGRTGQDLGLSWTAPKVRSGWGAMIGGKGGEAQDAHRHSHPGSKPLLRILPSGPAHEVLVKFQHRTIYSNVVNDGIVPLRTSCLFFLDWRGLDRVDKARRDNGLVGTMAEWSWAELTGANSKTPRSSRPTNEPEFDDTTKGCNNPKEGQRSTKVPPQPQGSVGNPQMCAEPTEPTTGQFLKKPQQADCHDVPDESRIHPSQPPHSHGVINDILSLFRPRETKSHASSHSHNKQAKIYKRSQTLNTLGNDGMPPDYGTQPPLPADENADVVLHAPPKTSVFESAGDLLMPPLPPTEFIVDPSSRPRTIFHDRIYHPDDIPPPVPHKRRALTLGLHHHHHGKGEHNIKAGSSQHSQLPQASDNSWNDPEHGLKVEEKIARAYHHDLSWRKVLVRLEPDAHNNIIVRRMFTNAFGWPVVKHLVDTHFGYTAAAQSEDTLAECEERAKPPNIGTTSSGDEIEGQTNLPPAFPPPKDLSTEVRH